MHTCVCMLLSGTWYCARSHCGSCHGLKPRPTQRETNMSFNTMFIMFMPVWFWWFLLCSWIELTCLEIGTPLARRPTWRNRNLAVGGQPCLIVHLDHQKVGIVTFGFLVRWVGLIPDASQHPYIRKDMRQDMNPVMRLVDGVSKWFWLEMFGFSVKWCSR